MGTRKTAGFVLAVVAVAAASVAPISAASADDPPATTRRISFESTTELVPGLDCVMTGSGTGTVVDHAWSTIELDVHFSCPAPAPVEEPPAG